MEESCRPEVREQAAQATRAGLAASPPDLKPSLELLPQSRRDFASPSSLPLLHMPAPPPELKNGKRVRKLKKRKTLKKSQGAEPPESSDTELDGEALRPRWLRSRRRPSGGSQVSTSTLPPEERDAGVDLEAGQEAPKPLTQSLRPEQTDFRPPKPLLALRLNCDSEEGMELAAACQQPQVDALVPGPAAQVPDTSRPEAHSLACNEVTSTSDMDICRSSERWGSAHSPLPRAATRRNLLSRPCEGRHLASGK